MVTSTLNPVRSRPLIFDLPGTLHRDCQESSARRAVREEYQTQSRSQSPSLPDPPALASQADPDLRDQSLLAAAGTVRPSDAGILDGESQNGSLAELDTDEGEGREAESPPKPIKKAKAKAKSRKSKLKAASASEDDNEIVEQPVMKVCLGPVNARSG